MLVAICSNPLPVYEVFFLKSTTIKSLDIPLLAVLVLALPVVAISKNVSAIAMFLTVFPGSFLEVLVLGADDDSYSVGLSLFIYLSCYDFVTPLYMVLDWVLTGLTLVHRDSRQLFPALSGIRLIAG